MSVMEMNADSFQIEDYNDQNGYPGGPGSALLACCQGNDCNCSPASSLLVVYLITVAWLNL